MSASSTTSSCRCLRAEHHDGPGEAGSNEPDRFIWTIAPTDEADNIFELAGRSTMKTSVADMQPIEDTFTVDADSA